MRFLLLVGSFVTATVASGCGQCAAICNNSAIITAVDAAGNPLVVESMTENSGLNPVAGSCGVSTVPSASPPMVTSYCPRFGLDVVATNGMRFSGVVDLSDGTNREPVCGSVCKTKNVTLQLQ